MNSGPTSKRVYAALKGLILDRSFRPGERLDPAWLGDTLSSSVTPVRDALHMLAGEGLVETRPSDGFQLPPIDEPGLRDLYAWNGQLIMLAIRSWASRPEIGVRATRERSPPDVAAAAGALFDEIALRSANAEHRRAVARLNDRLHAARLAEPGRLAGIGEELEALGSACGDANVAALRRLVAAYHRRRFRAAAQIVRALYRTASTRGGGRDNNLDIDAV